jgi:pteridine reductase
LEFVFWKLFGICGLEFGIFIKWRFISSLIINKNREAFLKGAAIVTGGAKRIGRSIALGLADLGYDIALHYLHSLEEAQSVASDIGKKGVQCHLFKCDLDQIDDVLEFMPKVFERFPECNLLINNASIFEKARLMDTDTEILDRFLNINFKAPFFLSRDFARYCQEGQIINILDTKISKEGVSYFAYALTKKALHEFTRMAAKALAPRIRVNGICPGMILPSKDLSEAEFEKLSLKIPVRRKGDPQSVVSAVRFLIENSFVTGDCIYVDGGEHLN